MNPTEINQAYQRTVDALDARELKNAFDQILGLMAGCRDYSASDRLDELQNTYRNLLRYRLAGTKDPMQETIYRDLRAAAYELNDTIRLRALSKESSTLYYNVRRALRREPYDFASRHATIRHLAEAIKEAHGQTEAHRQLEGQLSLLFQRVWTADALNAENYNSLRDLLKDPELPNDALCLVVSALTMSLMVFFDKEKVTLLFDAAERDEPTVLARALVGIFLTLALYRKRTSLYPRVNARLEALAERFAGFEKAIQSASIRFILARETEKITQQMQNEFLPEILKFSSKIGQKINLKEITPEQLLDEEMNPEWEKIPEAIDLEKKIAAFTELQEEGADLMHSTFVHLKNFPFFREISNWFLPFTLEHTALHEGSNIPIASDMAKLIADSAYFCNSDKYSFFLSLKMFPAEVRERLVGPKDSGLGGALSARNEQLLSGSAKIDSEIRKYVQDLYRFFKVHPSHLDFDDIFSLSLNFHDLPALKPYIDDAEHLLPIAEFCLRKKYYSEAKGIYEEMARKAPQDDTMFQKIGFCEQMNGQIQPAIDAYLHADLLKPDSPWVLRRLATCYRSLKRPDKALEYLHRYEAARPNDVSAQMAIGHCHLDLRDYQEASRCFFKADYLSGGGPKTWRPIAWCAFLNGRYDQAEEYYQKILSADASAQDYLNAGHAAWAKGNPLAAIERYRAAVNHLDHDTNRFLELFDADRPDLHAAGIEDEEISLVLDQLRYRLSD